MHCISPKNINNNAVKSCNNQEICLNNKTISKSEDIAMSSADFFINIESDLDKKN